MVGTSIQIEVVLGHLKIMFLTLSIHINAVLVHLRIMFGTFHQPRTLSCDVSIVGKLLEKHLTNRNKFLKTTTSVVVCILKIPSMLSM